MNDVVDRDFEPIELSIITPTYNRKKLVARSIESALNWSGPEVRFEIIVVDDGSTDGTTEYITSKFSSFVANGTLKYFRLAANIGVTGAKNHGISKARGRWLIFLDSDDELLLSTAMDVRAVLNSAQRQGLFFFRCIDRNTRELIGDEQTETKTLACRDLVCGTGYGECLPVVRRELSRRFSYDVDLYGSEGVAYCRMTAAGAILEVSPIKARIYDQNGLDRISSRALLYRRAKTIRKAHLRILKDCFAVLGVRGLLMTFARIIVWSFRGFLFSNRKKH